jgi:hypothetical protein
MESIMSENLYVMHSNAIASEGAKKVGVTRQEPIMKKRPRQIELTVQDQLGAHNNVSMEWHKEEEFSYLYEFMIQRWFTEKGYQHKWYAKNGHTEWFKVSLQQIWGAYGRAKQLTKGKEKQYYDWINSLGSTHVADWKTKKITKYSFNKRRTA